MASRLPLVVRECSAALVGLIALAVVSAVGAASGAPGREAASGSAMPQREMAAAPGVAASSTEELDAALLEVSVMAPEGSVDEGSVGTFRIRRNDSQGALRVTLRVAGTAKPETDYTLDGFAGYCADTVVVAFGEGQSSAVLAVDVVDDVAAEAIEMVTLTLSPDPGYSVAPGAGRAQLTIAQNDTVVTTTADSGEGSLRQAILNANALQGSHTITFDTEVGPFAEPQTIVLERPLPELTSDLTIDGRIEDRLWRATGVTVSGDRKHRVFKVGAKGRVIVRNLTIADGRAGVGAGLVNEGEVVVRGVTFLGNEAEQQGGALANSGGELTAINSTFTGNGAAVSGGALANLSGAATVTNCTFSENTAPRGGGLFSDGTLLLRNTILANSDGDADCVSVGEWDAAGTNNLIEANEGCGTPVITADPRLGSFGGYNGPTSTFPLGTGSPAINLGDNDSAVDENGEPLVWDQRGNGDPRFVGGFTDIGAFEHQKFPMLVVDTPEDSEIRACTQAGDADCSLRGAITLANAIGKPAHIRFDRSVFAEAEALRLSSPLPAIAVEATVDASSRSGIRIDTQSEFPVFRFKPALNEQD
jgi:predicted outer membrane repeat protein